MRDWYKRSIVKVVLVIAVFAGTLLMAWTMLIGYQMYTFGGTLSFSHQKYEDTEAFAHQLETAAYSVMDNINGQRRFETDGKFDPEKIIDIATYAETGEVLDEEEAEEGEGAILYRLGDLKQWAPLYEDGQYPAVSIAVCQKADGTYRYYEDEEFQRMLETGGIIDRFTEGGPGTYDAETPAAGDMSEDVLYARYYNAVENEFYRDKWKLEGIEEEYRPVRGESILNIVNNNSRLNGQLSWVYQRLENTLILMDDQIEAYENDEWEEGNTNLTYLMVEFEAGEVYTNNSTLYQKLDGGQKWYKGKLQTEIAEQRARREEEVDRLVREWEEEKGQNYIVVRPKLADFESDMDVSAPAWREMAEEYMGLDGSYLFLVAVDTSYPIQDSFYIEKKNYDAYAPYVGGLFAALIAAAILVLASVAWLTVIAGRREKDQELYLNGFDRWKTEPAALSVIFLWVAASMIFFGSGISTYQYGYTAWEMQEVKEVKMVQPVASSISVLEGSAFSVYVIVSVAVLLTGYLSLVRRIKAGVLWKNSITCSVYRHTREFWDRRKATGKTGFVIAGVLLLELFFIVMAYNNGSGLFYILLLLVQGVAAVLLMWDAVMKERIREGVRRIAAGDMEYKISSEGMDKTARGMAEDINNIGNGLQRAVEERIRSERLKTDLITNVSHDIKTPLTSIINYVDLLKRENLEDPRVKGYLDILEAKAQRLKTLTEDVVEASKVSSGNITLEYMDIDLVEMLNQTIGEFAEKFNARDLTIVANLPQRPAMIRADNRRLWRVLENLFNNAAKYAMPGTRVYVDLRMGDGKVVFSLKNISEQQLNISADELTERFIRGDVSRNTEGSGLGLSIARSLTEMQGGSFRLYLDGDLFKAEIAFPEK